MTQLSMFQISSALQSLRPGAQWALREGGYRTLEWVDSAQEQPTLPEIEAEVKRLGLE